MTNYETKLYTDAMNALTSATQNAINAAGRYYLQTAIDKLQERYALIQHLLDTSRDFQLTTFGNNYMEIEKCRRRLWPKLSEMNRAIIILLEIMQAIR